MADWWWVAVLVALAVAGVLFLRSRRASAGGSRADRPDGGAAAPDFRQDREDARVARMSEEDRAWEAASLRTDRETRERDDGQAGRQT